MIISKTFCDICKRECEQKRFGMIAGTVLKMNEKAEIKAMGYEGHFCEDDFIKITDFIEKLKNAEYNNTTGMDEQAEKRGADIGAE